MTTFGLPQHSTGKRWQAVKGEFISRFGTVWTAARLSCHPNSLRAAVEGACPGVRGRVEGMLASRESDVADELSSSRQIASLA
jgi:hypothetical protein